MLSPHLNVLFLFFWFKLNSFFVYFVNLYSGYTIVVIWSCFLAFKFSKENCGCIDLPCIWLGKQVFLITSFRGCLSERPLLS